MKHWYFVTIIILHLICTTLHCSFDTQYASLQQAPSYYNMSYVEIAATIDDFPALSYFRSFQPPRTDLVKARAILEGKVAILRETLSRHVPVDIIGITDVTSSREARVKQMHETESMISKLSYQIETMPL